MRWFRDVPRHLPTATGPYIPGMVDAMFGYTPEAPFVRFYYPTGENLSLKEQSKKWKCWIPDRSYLDGISKVLLIYKIFIRFMFWWADEVQIPALYGAVPKTNEKLKCVILSHGLGGNRFLYTNICCEMASRGFLVAALEHKDGSACNTYYYKTKIDAEKDLRSTLEFKHIQFGKGHFESRRKQIKQRSEECCRVLDLLIGLENGTVPYNVIQDVPTNKDNEIKLEDFVGKLDLRNITMMGHSFGAATALYTLGQRKEFKLGILLDPWMFPIKDEHLDLKITQPLLFINTQTFHIASNINAMEKFLSIKDTETYTILHTTHENQTDSVLIVGYWLNWFMKKLDGLQALRINNALIFTFLNKHLGFPNDISNCQEILKDEHNNIDVGLTKPWA